MQIKQTVLEIIKDKRIRRRLAEALDTTDAIIVNYIKRNHDNLTKAAALKVIRDELKITDDQILEEVPENARA
jgi:hypothetical protein